MMNLSAAGKITGALRMICHSNPIMSQAGRQAGFFHLGGNKESVKCQAWGFTNGTLKNEYSLLIHLSSVFN